MVLVRVAVALISGWWLDRGDAALAELTRLAVASATRPRGVAARAAGRTRRGHAPRPRGGRTALALLSSPPLAATITRRGPPTALSAC
ncbi:hypothetical protein [Nonomuraea pusilla]|uniref:hypothetical protein n=1 Tax=Nonomuraea pusilla TaxID=46177 RepID=UPI000B814693|nr:hypothetical protein [Nonomuraea pusilla]